MTKLHEQNIEQIKKLLNRFDSSSVQDAQTKVTEIIQAVKTDGDAALKKYNLELDNYNGKLRFELEHFNEELVSPELKTALELAAKRIEFYHQQEISHIQDWQFTDSLSIKLGLRYQPLDAVAIYIPGGTAPLVSTVLMTAIPAKAAGVKRIVLISPPTNQGLTAINPSILYAAKLAGVNEVYCVGGAQSIAAVAYGTETIAAVDKVVGPGNIYVSLAKKEVFGKIGIDGIYGPSELAIIADKTASPISIAADLLSQLEHGSGLESCLLLSDNQALISETRIELDEQINVLAEKHKTEKQIATIKYSLENHSAFLHYKSEQEAAELINLYAPEHLEIQTQSPESLLGLIKHAGAIFIGHHACESFGDYLAGPSHCLPTAASARFSSGLQCSDFMKKSSLLDFRNCDPEQNEFIDLVQKTAIIARAEGLEAHAKAAERRTEY